jgi:putative MATE family efflux protein
VSQKHPVAGGRGVWALAWPGMALFALHSLVGVVDFVFVSSLGTGAVAAVGVATQIHFFGFALLSAVSAGTVAVAAREWGRGEADEAARATRCSVALSVGFGLLLMFGIPWSESIVSWLGVRAEVAALGGECLAILLWFSLPFAVEVTLSQALWAIGDVRTPLLVGIVTNLLNAVACYALVFGRLGAPELGAVGSAWAGGASFAVGLVLLWGLWARGWLALPVGRWRGSVTRLLAWRIVRVGIPTALERAAWSGGLLVFMGVVAGFGTASISAYLIGVRILAFCFVPGSGFAMAAATLVGQNLGAEQPQLAARSGWRSMLGALAVMGGVGLSIVLLARPLASLFGAAGEETIALAVTFIYILGAAQPLMAIEFSLSGALRGAGDTRFPLLAILVGLFVFRLGAAVLIAKPLFGTVTAVWLCLLVDYAVKAAMLAWRFASGRWQALEV